MSIRTYVSPARTAAAEEKRQRVVEAAGNLLREETGITAFSLDAVAKAAEVTRLTVYNQFGSRRGLLEAVFDQCAQQGGLARIPEAMAMSDPRAALHQLISIFCEFWGSDSAVGQLHDAIALDPEFAQALAERNERRRYAITNLIRRLKPKSVSHSHTSRDCVDLIFSLTSYATFRLLSRDRTIAAVEAIVREACDAALDRLPRPSSS
ncbi:MAG: TetR/AcrR family transcriptional regulator [Herminiimonas sp.]|nr:TetR/AcrR family transcriptional regulator [Herminiimonas sp.]